jgi:hypothetical protein
MTPAANTYCVVYPHPLLRPRHRGCLCEIDSETLWKDFLNQLFEEYPRYVEDLKGAILWKVTIFPPNRLASAPDYHCRPAISI